MSLTQLTATRASAAVVVIRLYVGPIFAGQGVLKFLRPDALGPGRFDKAGMPAGTFFAYLDGILEVGCGLPILGGQAPLYPKEGGFWDFFHEGRLEVAMLCGSIFLLIVGAGGYSIDARLNDVGCSAVMT